MALTLNGDNTASTPGYAGSDSDTGLQPGTNELDLVTGGTSRVKIDSSGRVGIGINSPSGTLQVHDGTFILSKPASGSERNWRFLPSNAAAGDLSLQQSTTAGGTTYDTKFHISAAGNVGIGTTSAERLLHVFDSDTSITSNSSSTLVLERNGVNVLNILKPNGTAGILSFSGNSTNADGRITYDDSSSRAMEFWAASGERARIDSSGRLLVGTTSTSASTRLVVQGNSASSSGTGSMYLRRGNDAIGSGVNIGEIVFTNNADQTGAYILATSDAAWTLGSSHPTRLGFFTTASSSTSPTERMKIDKNGNVFSVPIYNATTAASANVIVESSGQLSRATSSGKYKTNIETLEDSYADALLSCRPVWYRSTCEGDNPEHGWWGFIAEEVAEIDPRLVFWKTVEVTYDEKGSAVETPCDPEAEGVAYDRFVPHLLNLIKRQKEAIEALETRVAQLEGGAS